MRGSILENEQVQTPDPSRASIPLAHAPQGPTALIGESFAQLTRGLGAASVAYERTQDEEARAWASNTLAGTRLKWSQELADRQANAGPNAPDFTSNYVRDFSKDADELLSKAPNVASQKYLRERLNSVLVEYGEKAKTFEAQARIDYRADQFNAAIDNSRKLMNTDPSQYQSVLAERVAEIDSSSMPPIKKSALRQRAVDEISQAAVWSQIQKSPKGFLESIGYMNAMDDTGHMRKDKVDLQGRTGNDAFDMLPFDKRTQLFEQAIRAKAQIDADADRATAKFTKQLSDDTAKRMWGMQADGKLKRQDIENNAPLLSVEEYRSLLKATSGEAAQKSDPAAYRDVAMLIAQDKFKDAEAAAFQHHRAGNLSNADLTSFVDRARTQARQEGPKSPYEASSAWIARSMDPGPMIHDPVGKGRFADAMKEFDDWYAANPQAPKEVMDKRAKEIVGQYKMVDMQETLIGLPNPRSGAISRNAGDPAKVMQDVIRVGNEAKRRFDAKQYTLPEYQDEMQKINSIRALIEGQKKAR